MKAISLWQPWASAIALGLKKIETRSRLTWHEGELAICASKRCTPELQRTFAWLLAGDCSVKHIFESALAHTEPELRHLPLGCVVAVANLQECVRTDMISNLTPIELSLGDYTAGRYGWILRDVRALREPVPVIGRQFLFDLPADVEAKVREQI